MNYTNAVLLLLGILGILLHNLIKINELNQKSEGKFSLISYLKIEWIAIIISFVVVLTAIIVKREIAELEAVGKWLGVGFIALGYMGQSVVIALMGKANKLIGNDNG